MRTERLTPAQMLLWTALGVGTGLVAGVALSEWLGDVNRTRLQRAATRLQTPARRPLSAAATARAAEAALEAQPALRDLGLTAQAVGRGTVELRGWVPSRSARTLAGRTVGALPGIDSIINSILVRGEDDRPAARSQAATDRTA